MSEPLLLSSSSIASFKRCRRQYYYAYELSLRENEKKEVMENGTSFHKYMEMHNKDIHIDADMEDPMYHVYVEYITNRGLPPGAVVLSVEEPHWVQLDDDTYMRFTPDVVYRLPSGFVVARDYKTFEKMPTIDIDLDFQGRVYSHLLKKKYGDDFWFEYEHVRQTPPGVPHNKKGDKWTPEECYISTPLVISKQEGDELWAETMEVVADIRRAKERGGAAWYRQDQKGWNGCSGCFMRHVCKAEAQLGYLDDQTVAMNYTKREPLELPEDMKT